MATKRLMRLLILGGALTGLSACGSAPLPGAVQAVPTQRFHSAGSWISPSAAKGDLLYVADARRTVDVFSYPGLKPVGKLTGFDSPAGLCSDSSGNVYVADTGLFELVEYAHGGTTPIKTLFVMGYFPFGCAVDPSSGDIAVADVASQKQGPGGVSIFHPGQGLPSTYQDPAFNAYFFCSYDQNGNLFVDGSDYGSYHTLFAELPNGSTSFSAISLDKTIGYPGGVAWDGTQLVTQDTTNSILYRFKISGSRGKTAGSTSFAGNRSTLLHSFSIAGSSIVMPYGTTSRIVRKVGIWPYPSGGTASKSINVLHATELVGVTLSVAKK